MTVISVYASYVKGLNLNKLNIKMLWPSWIQVLNLASSCNAMPNILIILYFAKIFTDNNEWDLGTSIYDLSDKNYDLKRNIRRKYTYR